MFLRLIRVGLSVALLAVAFADPALATHSSSDIDGDGWPDVSDKCPRVYNDRGRDIQYDNDLDGVADPCDFTFVPTNDGSRSWMLIFHFIDSAGEPVVADTCATLRTTETVHYGPPYNFDSTSTSSPFRVCLDDGWSMRSYHSNGSNVTSLSRSYEITCDSGGVLTGSLPDGVVTSLAVSPDCTQLSPMHLFGGGPPGDFTPEVSMLGAPQTWTGPYALSFDASQSYDPEGGAITYLWDFGDGETSMSMNPSHAYAAPGTYTAKLTVTDPTGTAGVKSEVLTITGDPAKDFAPEIRLHPSESDFPMTPSSFIANSTLHWAHDAGCNDDYLVSPVSESRLGAGNYKHREADDISCRDGGPWYDSNDYTRPYDGGNAGRVPIDDAEGFALNFNPSAAPSSFSPVPVWRQTTGNIFTYWLFYGRSVPRSGGSALPTQHEGDWEHVNVEINAAKIPVLVWFYQHGGSPQKIAYSAVSQSNLIHPVAYSARGSHASYPDAGTTSVCSSFGCIDDVRAGGGPVWRTWNDIRDVTTQPWYGFGGAWGEVGQLGDTTGPLGPSPYKNPIGS